MKSKVFAVTLALLLFVSVLQSASAIVVTSVIADTLEPGQEGSIKIDIENILQTDVEDITLTLDLTNLPFIPIGSTSDGFDQLDEGDDGRFNYRIRASNTIVPGDYQIPYTIKFVQDDEQKERKGSIGIKVTADTEISFSVDTETPVIGKEGKINFRIINSGYTDARFANIKVLPNGFTLLSEKEVYIGNVDSDDFETVTFDVIFTDNLPTFTAIVSYTDFNNKKITKNVNLPVEVYTPERAVELGIIERSNTALYVGTAVLLIILWFAWRALRKRRRMKRSERS